MQQLRYHWWGNTPSYKLQEEYLSSRCLIKFSWTVSRSERCFQHVSNLCVTLESHTQLTLITTDFKMRIVGVPCAHFLLLLAGEVKPLAGVLFLFIKIIEGFFCIRKNQYQLYSSMLAVKSMLLLYFYHYIIPKIRNCF